MPYPAAFYAALHRGTPGDLEVYARICEGASSILELGCGYGRVLTALAAPDRTLVGVDRDPELLAMARAAVEALPPAARAGVTLVEDDMRRVDLGRRFDRVLVPFGGLYCMLDDAELDRALATIVRHLAPGGQAAFDVYRADEFHATAEPDDVPDDAFAPLTRVMVQGRPYEVLERSEWDRQRQRIDVEYLYVGPDDAMVRGVIEQRYLLEAQLRDAIARAGLTIVSLGRGFGAPPEEDEDEPMVVVVEEVGE